jgi:hypothetical protein
MIEVQWIFQEGTTFGEIVKAMETEGRYPTVLVMVNGRLKELHKTLKEGLQDRSTGDHRGIPLAIKPTEEVRHFCFC